MNKICFGCGAKLQSIDKDKEGYVIERKIEEAKYCERCFKQMHYGVYKKSLEPKKTKDIVNTINKNASFVIFLSDFISLSSINIDIFKQIKVPKILAISKADIIPSNINYSQIKSYIRSTYKIKDDIIFTSSKSSLNSLNKVLYDKNEVYILGETNAGKSTLINALIKQNNSSNTKLTTSYKENTTQDFVRIKLNDKLTIIDSPGFVGDSFEISKMTNIDKEIKPITYQNKVKCTYKVGDIYINIDGISSLTFYMSNNISIERLYNKEIIGTSINISKNSDIIIKGIGFIKVTSDITFTISEELFKYIIIRPSITGGIYE